jgi:hypothetical protein
MSITRSDMQAYRLEYLKDVSLRDSWENDAEVIKIAVLMSNNNGFTVYKSLPMKYEESRFNLIIEYLTNLFVDSSVTFMVEEETGKKTIVVDWSLS